MKYVKLEVIESVWILSRRDGEGFPWVTWFLMENEAREVQRLLCAEIVKRDPALKALNEI